LALIVTVQVDAVAVVHPLHAEKLLPPAADGAVSVTVAPARYVSAKLVVPLLVPLRSAGLAVTAAPVEGFADCTVKT
jgi:hypothetical protein